MEKYCRIYVVRHGQTEANLADMVAGHFDSPLTKFGEIQAEQRALDLKHIKFDAVFSSDLVRAKRTAEIISAERQLAVSTTKLIREKFFGTYEGKPAEIFRNDNKKHFEILKSLTIQQRMNFKYEPTQESDAEVVSRTIVFLREIGAPYAGKTVLVVAHGSLMRSFLKHVGYAAYDELPAGSVDNTGYFVLETDGVDFFIKETKGINKVTTS